MAVNCCVAPSTIFALEGPTDIDFSVLADGAGVLEELPPHPVLTITSESKNQETGMQSQGRRMTIYLVSEKGESATTAEQLSKIAAMEHRGHNDFAHAPPRWPLVARS